MNRGRSVAFLLLCMVVVPACSTKPSTSSVPEATASPQASTESPQLGSLTPTTSPAATTPATDSNNLALGQASGSYTAKGEVVELKYAYAGRGVRFGNEAIIILITDRPIPPESVAEEIQSQTLLLAEKIRGLEYVIDKDALWVRFHPSQYQESSNNRLKEYTVEGDVVRGFDDDSLNLSDGKYSRKVRFAAAIVK